jgi:hypothetical protein
MGTIDRLINNVKTLNVTDVIAESMDATMSELVKFQKYQMLMGYRADGERIGKYRNKYYAAQKYKLNPLAGYGYVDLKLEGYFQGDIFVDVRDMSKSVVFSSMDPKVNDLTEKYGDEIWGLRTETAQEYSVMYLQPEGVKRIRQHILR